jgi:hypothetical protein
MTNHNSNDLSTGSPADEDRQMPLSFEDGKEAITVAPGSGRKRLGFGAMLFGSVAVIAVVSLFSMRAIGRAGAAAPAETESEALVDKFLTEREGKSEQALGSALLDVDGSMRTRIPTEDLKKNPFILMGEDPGSGSGPSKAMKVDGTETAPGPEPDMISPRNSTWDALCAAAARAAHVQSAMVSSNPANSMAHVNGQVLRVGETLSINGSTVVFTITEITKDGILLRAWNEDLQREAVFRVAVGKGN